MSKVDIDNYYTDDEIKDHLRDDREEQERLEAEKESFFDEDNLIFDDESEDDYTQDSLIEQYDLSDDEFEEGGD